MVAFVPTDLPASINTVEKVHAWCAMVLNHLHPTQTVVETPGQAERVITAQPFFITASDPQTWRFIARGSIPVNPNWQRQGKFWEHAQDLSTQAIPTEFKS